jgi:hypothetical protein
MKRFVPGSALSLAKSTSAEMKRSNRRGVYRRIRENLRIDCERAMVTRILLAAILCLIPAYTAAPRPTPALGATSLAIHHLMGSTPKLWILSIRT